MEEESSFPDLESSCPDLEKEFSQDVFRVPRPPSFALIDSSTTSDDSEPVSTTTSHKRGLNISTGSNSAENW